MTQYLQRSATAQRLGEFASAARQNYPSVFAGVRLDDAGRPVVTLTDGPTALAARAAAESAGFTIETIADPESTPKSVVSAGTTLVADGPPVVGGTPYFITTNGRRSNGGPCSTGFNGIDSEGNTVNITAGHCDMDRAATGTPDAAALVLDLAPPPGRPLGTVRRIGSFQKSMFGGRDYAIVRIVDPAAESRFQNNLVGVRGGPAIPIDGVADPVVGAPACKSGATTGFTCGTVRGVDESLTTNGNVLLHNMFWADILAVPGDSGGPVVTGTKALGIVSASTIGEIGPAQPVPVTIAQPIAIVLAENPGLRIRTE
ncbi:S1 family peptidase [Nocardia sp. CDC159]|uniref:S1 family peptidase n=1 Tax=Nocardia pulmonis TaxID=2951408 RepID=A0A9X2E516_9NOCA|nr:MULTISPECIES: S1 family peptidase [Nocardia]MCM6773751.1 S1 family peptidase [Nocardia pulmonis]MCM6786638.1 S1 family peptidase [Nocardia sp. CDC159]